jgi:hypothetical protein
MNARIKGLERGLALLASAGALGLWGSAVSWAQFAPSLPYSPFNSQNLTFSYPTLINPSLPNQSRLMYGPPSQFPGNSLDTGLPLLPGTEGLGTGSFPRGGRGVPYYQSSRAPERFSSSYADADAEFAANQSRRDALYVQIAQERDPKKQSALQKELAEVNAALEKGMGKTQRRTGTARSGKVASALDAGEAGAGKPRRTPLDPPRRTGAAKRASSSSRRLALPPDELDKPADSAAAEPAASAGESAERSAEGVTDPAESAPSPAVDSSRLPRRRSSLLSDVPSPNSFRQRGSSFSTSSGGLERAVAAPSSRVSPRTPEVKPPTSTGTESDSPGTP